MKRFKLFKFFNKSLEEPFKFKFLDIIPQIKAFNYLMGYENSYNELIEEMSNLNAKQIILTSKIFLEIIKLIEEDERVLLINFFENVPEELQKKIDYYIEDFNRNKNDQLFHFLRLFGDTNGVDIKEVVIGKRGVGKMVFYSNGIFIVEEELIKRSKELLKKVFEIEDI